MIHVFFQSNFHNPLYERLFTRTANGHQTTERTQLLDHDGLADEDNTSDEEKPTLIDIADPSLDDSVV